MKADWHQALSAARKGDLEPARRLREEGRSGGLADYFHGRCLAEAETELDASVAELRRAVEVEPRNPLFNQTLALALARQESPTAAREADRIWKRHGLPHELNLLAQTALTLEGQTRPWPAHSEAGEMAWPAALAHPRFGQAEETGLKGRESETEADNLTREAGTVGRPGSAGLETGAPRKMKKPSGRELNRLERMLLKHQAIEALRLVGEVLDQGREDAHLHLGGGVAAEIAGDPARARAHLTRALELESGQLLARAWLGRVYWRSGWWEMAEAVWRSLPVEGPYDYGRHYHLALALDGKGDRAGALAAMEVALKDFFYDTFHYSIRDAWRRWQLRQGLEASQAGAGNRPVAPAGPDPALSGTEGAPGSGNDKNDHAALRM